MKRRTLAWTVCAGIAANLVALATALPGAQAAPRSAAPAKSAVVVYRVWRSPIGQMLATKTGASLYFLPTGSCTGSCLQAWPPLLMPSGATTPLGASCLHTAPFGANGRLQVTYHGQRLYTFSGDSGGSVNGNEVGGFEAAATTARCP